MALATTQDVILLFGDSLTQGSTETSGLAQRLSSLYVRKFDVVNRGLNGYQTDWALLIFEQLLAKRGEQGNAPKVQLLTIWFGANDAAPVPEGQHVPIERFKENLVLLVNTVKSETSPYYSPDTRIILITPPPVNSHTWTTRNFAQTQEYAKAVIEVAAHVGVPVADVWTKIWDAAGHDESSLDRFLYDGLHLNADGYEIVSNLVLDIIAKEYPKIHHANLQTAFTPFELVTADNPPRLRSVFDRE